MTSFSDYLAHHGVPRGDDDEPGEHVAIVHPGPLSGDDDEFSGPDPRTIPGVEVVELFTTVDGQRRVPDDKLTEEEVQQVIRRMKLNPREIRGEQLLTNRDAATFLGVSISTLKEWRNRNINLPYYVTPVAGFNNRRILYRLADLIRYREFVYTHFTPDNVTLPAPGMMGTPLT